MTIGAIKSMAGKQAERVGKRWRDGKVGKFFVAEGTEMEVAKVEGPRRKMERAGKGLSERWSEGKSEEGRAEEL